MSTPMPAGNWWSQRFAAEGAAAAEGISRQLGRPSLDPLTIMVREAAQNSWDARTSPRPVDFSIHVRTVNQSDDAWRVLTPGPLGSEDTLREALEPGSHLILISDRGTRGLGGPLRADEKAPDGVTADFVQFLRNVGEPSDQKLGGGTYGFGKGILYGVSNASAILVDSHCAQAYGPSRRLMGASLSHSFYDGDVRYTGRHWWGDCSQDIPYPLVEDEAADLSDRLGLDGFADGRTGTDIAILGANLGFYVGADGAESPRTPRQAAEFIASSIAWHLWPKAGSAHREAVMRFRVFAETDEVPVPTPSTTAELAGFSAALDAIHGGESVPYRRSVDPKRAGELALGIGAAVPASQGDIGRIMTVARPFEPPYRHVARMRSAELVVDYFAGPEHPDTALGYTGVFAASEAADSAFAAAEPPTHDAWIVNGLEGRQRGVVQFLPRFLRSEIMAVLPQPSTAAAAMSGLGRFAAQLGNLVTAPGLGLGGTATVDPSRGTIVERPATTRREGRRRASTPTISAGPTLVVRGGGPLLEAHVSVPSSDVTRSLTLVPSVVLVGGARETDPPAGVRESRVIGWWRVGRSVWTCEGPTLTVHPSDVDLSFGVAVEYHPDAAVRFQLHVEER